MSDQEQPDGPSSAEIGRHATLAFNCLSEALNAKLQKSGAEFPVPCRKLLKRIGMDYTAYRGWAPTDDELGQIRAAGDLLLRLPKLSSYEAAESAGQLISLLAGNPVGIGMLAKLAEAAEHDYRRRCQPTVLTAKPDTSASMRRSPEIPLPTSSAAPHRPKRAVNGPSIRNLKDKAKELSARMRSVPSVSDWGAKNTEFVVYIDETWFKKDPQKGTIAGIVWLGKGVDLKALPVVQTHLCQDGKMNAAHQALMNLISCKHAFPFCMPIRMDVPGAALAANAAQRYDELLRAALHVLLGWLLPCKGPRATLRIFMEEISGHKRGDSAKSLFEGYLAALSDMSARRFARWKLVDAGWIGKDDQSYLGYADILAYASNDDKNPRNATLLAPIMQLPGYIPLSLDLVRHLPLLDREHDFLLDELLDFCALAGKSVLRQRVLDHYRELLQNNTRDRLQLLETLDRRYMAKDRDLRMLRPQTAGVREVIPDLPLQASPRTRLLWAAIELQDANHHGNPERASIAAEQYAGLRDAVAKDDLHLVVHGDLHLAVAAADAFRFSESQRLVQRLVQEPWFSHLARLERGAAQSALGQYFAMQGEPDNAERCFRDALTLLQQADIPEEKRSGEVAQTSTYRAINALDARSADAISLVEVAIGPLPLAAMECSRGNDRPYRHYLLLRCIHYRPYDAVVGEARQRYLAEIDNWGSGASHPWPLIGLYRGLLLGCENSSDERARACFDEAIACAGSELHGATLQLMAAMIAAVGACILSDSRLMAARGMNLLDSVERRLPGATSAIATLRSVLEAPASRKTEIALGALPFNYH